MTEEATKAVDPQEDFERWREAKVSDIERERDDAYGYFVNAWAKIGYLAEARATEIGRKLAKLQNRVHRQRVANRELLGRITELETELGLRTDEVRFYIENGEWPDGEPDWME